MQIYLPNFRNVLENFVLAAAFLTLGPSQNFSVFQDYERPEETTQQSKKRSNLTKKEANDVPMYVKCILKPAQRSA